MSEAVFVREQRRTKCVFECVHLSGDVGSVDVAYRKERKRVIERSFVRLGVGVCERERERERDKNGRARSRSRRRSALRQQKRKMPFSLSLTHSQRRYQQQQQEQHHRRRWDTTFKAQIRRARNVAIGGRGGLSPLPCFGLCVSRTSVFGRGHIASRVGVGWWWRSKERRFERRVWGRKIRLSPFVWISLSSYLSLFVSLLLSLSLFVCMSPSLSLSLSLSFLCHCALFVFVFCYSPTIDFACLFACLSVCLPVCLCVSHLSNALTFSVEPNLTHMLNQNPHLQFSSHRAYVYVLNILFSFHSLFKK